MDADWGDRGRVDYSRPEQKLSKVDPVYVDPALCRPLISDFPPRDLNERTCADLIEAIRSMGQQDPVVLRLPPQEDGPLEVVCGSRRVWAVDWLKRNEDPDLLLKAKLVALTDEEAFRLSVAANSDRADLSPFTRGSVLARAFVRYYGYSYEKMAKALRMRQGELKALIALAMLPSEILAAVVDTSKLTTALVAPLQYRLNNVKRRTSILVRAAELAAEQQERLRHGKPLIELRAIIHDLCGQPPIGGRRENQIDYRASSGELVARVISGDRSSGQMIVRSPAGIPKEERTALLHQALKFFIDPE